MNFLLLLLLPYLARCKESIPTLTLPLDASVLTTVNPYFISYTTDWWTNSDGWGEGTAVVNIDLKSPKLQAAAAALSPAIWRMGGTRADKIRYDLKDYGNESVYDENPHCRFDWCLTRNRWLELLEFAEKSKARIVFTLNYVQNTESTPGDKSTIDGQEWDSTGARELMELSKVVDPTGLIYGFELGNEVKHGSLDMDLERLGRAYQKLSSILTEVWPEVETRPKLLGPATSGSGYKEYLPHIGEYLDILTYHKYQHSGTDPNLTEIVLQPDFLWKPAVYSNHVKHAAEFGLKEVWIGEGAMASHSGRPNVTDTFMSTLWFTNALGSMSKAQPLPITTMCRQTLVGGFYGLLNQYTYDPNPDFYMMRLWKHLVGQQTLDSIETTIKDQELLRVHAFCGVIPGEVVLIFVSIDQYSRTLLVPMGTKRDVYRLQGYPSVRGKQVQLNGSIQFMAEDGSLPDIVPVTESPEQALGIPPQSVTFVVLHETGITACGSKPELDTKPNVPSPVPTTPPPSPSTSSSSSSSRVAIWLLGIVVLNILVALVIRHLRQLNETRHTEVAQFDPSEQEDNEII